MEGVLGYNNAIVLTAGMFIDDLKYLRDPVYSYGPWVSAGEIVEERQVRRQPRRPGELVEQLHAVHLRGRLALLPAARRPEAIVENLARYAEYDVKGRSTPTTSTTTASSSTTGAR